MPSLALLVFAAEPTAWEQLQHTPTQVWINLGICVLAVVVIVRVWRALKAFNDYAPYFAIALAGSMILFYWVYERTEPAFLSPVVEHLTGFFPTKGKQQEHIERVRKSRE